MAKLIHPSLLLASEGWGDYALVDSGAGRKLERYGPYRFIRPEPQALWPPRLSPDSAEWAADAAFLPGADEDGGGRWAFREGSNVPREGWPLAWHDANARAWRFTARCTPFRHLGFFPDMAPVWGWMATMLSAQDQAATLNLFGYTGLATLALSPFGPVTHVDASKLAVSQARANAMLSGVSDAPLRWIVDDAAKFTAREVRRGKRYDGIILDPPKFGRGPGGEVWRLEEHLPALIADCRRLLDADSRFLFLTCYAVRMSALALAGLLAAAFADLPGAIEYGELAVAEAGAGIRLLPTAIFARWRCE